jgi:hypothetical protein
MSKRVQHFDDDIASGQVVPTMCLSGQTAARLHDCMRDGAATDAGAGAVISIANPIAMLRQIETSSNTVVRILVAVRGMLPSLMTSMGEPPAWAGASLPSAFTS